MPSAELLDLARRAVGWAAPGEEVEVYATRGESLSVDAYQGEVESLSADTTAGAGVRVVVGHRQGFAWTGALDEAALAEALAEARENAAFGEPAEWNGLALPDGVPAPEVDIDRPQLAALPRAAKIDLALDLERAVLAADGRITGVRTASYSEDRTERAVASTTGIEAWGRSGSCGLYVSAMADDGSGTRTGAGSASGREPAELDPDEVAAEAADKAVRLLGATKPASRRLTVVLEPEVTAAFVGILGRLVSGMAVLKGKSLFAGRLGQRVAAEVFSLTDDPTDPEGFGAMAHDAEGLASRRNVLIDAGKLCGFVYDGATARRAGTVSTASAMRSYQSVPAPGCRSLAVAAGVSPAEELVAGIDDGFVVQSVKGLHSGVNSISGDFSVGAEGLRIRGGDMAEPVAGVTVASSLPRMLLDLSAVGSDLRRFGHTTVPTLVVSEMAMAGA
ncbi:MAG: TldD/PmbA family protein [Actinobacteria bacterium]|nr:TldD/PmbA family protein [Actinomycetota bacterium]